MVTTWINRQVAAKVRATMLSFSSQVDDLGQMTGGPILGSVGSLFGLRMALRGSAALLMPAVVVLLRLGKRSDIGIE